MKPRIKYRWSEGAWVVVDSDTDNMTTFNRIFGKTWVAGCAPAFYGQDPYDWATQLTLTARPFQERQEA